MVIEAQQPWGVVLSDLFEPSLKQHTRVFADLPDKLAKFLEVKLQNPLTVRYGKHDGPFSGALAGFLHCHLRDDAILIYHLKNRNINLIMIVSHAEIEKKSALMIKKKIAPYLGGK